MKPLALTPLVLILAACAGGETPSTPVLAQQLTTSLVTFIDKDSVKRAFAPEMTESALQSSASELSFRQVSTISTTWRCVKKTSPFNLTGPFSSYEVTTTYLDVVPKLNPQQKVTGFNVLGSLDTQTESIGDRAPGTCQNANFELFIPSDADALAATMDAQVQLQVLGPQEPEAEVVLEADWRNIEPSDPAASDDA
jgi:hypothetical protein